MPRPVLRPRVALFAVALAAATTAAAMPAVASASAPRTEVPIVSTSPQTDVLSSVVSLRVPMLPGAAAHPEACNWISYERWRSADGPSDPTQADAVAILQPGVLEGATAFDAVARNSVEREASVGRHIEVWGIDRRSNCLEDHTGTDATEQSGDPMDAINYYYHHAAINGKTFAGFDINTRVLADMGIPQTVNDEYSILTNELPSQPWREKHVVCGGHSLGGPLTEIFAGWDFDGSKATNDDAGYRQCAGFFGFDTILDGAALDTLHPPGNDLLGKLGGGILGAVNSGTVAALKSGLVPRDVDLFGINPESMNALEMISLLAEKSPNTEATPLVNAVPKDKHIEDFFHIAGSPDLASWLTGKNSVRDFRYTNMALLGQVMDDNGAAYGLVRTSFGFFSGAPIRINDLPSQAQYVPGLSQLITPGKLVMPQKQSKQLLTTWVNYDQLGSGATQIGKGLTTPADEVTDDVQFARAIHEGPLNLTENYFPIRIVVDEALLAAGVRSGDLANAMYPHATLKKVRETVIAGDGILGAKSKVVDPRVIAPGYQHLDVLTAAQQQNNGQPEISSTTFSNLIDAAVPQP